MKNIIDLERKLYKDLFLNIILVILSIPLWLNFGVDASAQEAQYYDDYNYIQYEFLNKPNTTAISAYDDTLALIECETQDILIYNDSNTVDKYSLVLKINKDTKLDLNKIKINVNYNVDFLSNYHVYDDALSYYYVIDSDLIAASSQKYVISMWTEVVQEDNHLEYEFVVL